MPTKNYIGKKIGYIEILEKTNERKNGYIVYKCKCHKCNKIVYKTLEHITTREKQGHNNITCGCFDYHKNNLYKHGLSNTRLYNIYVNMKQRCYDKNSISYKDYGERGITICQEWLNDFKTFYKWAIENGYKNNLTIDRINNNGNYEPNNCRWANAYEQSNNRRNNVILEYNGVKKTLIEYAKEYNIEICTLRSRIKRGWNIERALNEKTHLNYKGKK